MNKIRLVYKTDKNNLIATYHLFKTNRMISSQIQYKNYKSTKYDSK
jgi:hypothetical protein